MLLYHYPTLNRNNAQQKFYILIFYNVFSMSKAIKELIHEGYPITKKVISKLSPYRTSHINRFGTYKIEKLPIQKEDFNFKLDLS